MIKLFKLIFTKKKKQSLFELIGHWSDHVTEPISMGYGIKKNKEIKQEIEKL